MYGACMAISEPTPGPTSKSAQKAEKQIAMAELAAHASALNCWMAIEGVAYDFTAYLPKHPSDPKVFLKYCGRDGTVGFRTKDAGRPHSPYARGLLNEYKVGALKP